MNYSLVADKHIGVLPFPKRSAATWAGGFKPYSICPKCISPMEPVVFRHVVVDRCTSCQGLWLEAAQREVLQQMTGAESLDVGDPAVGREFDPVNVIDCPRCRVRLMHLVDRHANVGYEKCPACGGEYYDAGELRRLPNGPVGSVSPERRAEPVQA